MATRNASTNSATPQQPYYPYGQPETPPLGTRKTILVLGIVIICIAVLWPRIFQPMMFGGTEEPVKNNYINKDLKPGALRQERPPHLRGDHIHPAMIERGRAIPNTQSVPIVNDRPQRANDHVQIIDGRPGPIPGMRPPMGAGSVHQANQKGSSVGLLMPVYTFGIVAFFAYTVMKLCMRRNESLGPYPQPQPQTNGDTFKQEVFRRENQIPNLEWNQHDTSSHANGILNNLLNHLNGNNHHSQASNYGRSFNDETSTAAKLEYQLRETEQLLEISLLKKKLRETERAMEQIIADIHGKAAKCNGNDMNATNKNVTTMDVTTTQNATDESKDKQIDSDKTNGHIKMTDSEDNVSGGDDSTEATKTNEFIKIENAVRGRDSSVERKLKSSNESEPEEEPQSIFLEGALPHESQILVSDSQTTPEGVYNEEVNGNSDEPAVILSSKMTLSLINLDPVNNESGGNASNGASDEEIQYEEEIEEEEEVEEEEEEVEIDDDDDENNIENVHGVAK